MWVQPFRSAETEFYPPREAPDARVAVLLNAKARKVTDKVIRSLTHVVPDGDLFISRSELDARRIAQQVVDRRYPTVFLGGGDGTLTCFLNEIANQVALRRHHLPTRMPRFGVLKLGTGNSMATLVKASPLRGDGIVDDVLRARSGEVPGYRTVDMMLVEGKRAPFAGLGLDGLILNDYLWVKQNLAQGPLEKLMTGPAGYFTSVAFRSIPTTLARPAAVECEVVNGQATQAYRMGASGEVEQTYQPGEVLYKGPMVMTAAATIPYYGYEFRMFPFAGKRRGMMQLRLANLTTPTILANLGPIWRGTWHGEGLHDFLTADATVRFSRPMPLQIAGDAEGYREELRLQVAPEPIEVLDYTGAAVH